MKEQLASNVAELLLNRQPPSIRRRLQKGNALEGLGIMTYQGMTIAGTSILLRHLLAAARRILSGESEQQLWGVTGGEAHVTRSEGAFVISVQQGEQLFYTPMSFLDLISPDQSERLGAFEEAIRQLGSTSNISTIRTIVTERPLTDEEMEAIADELSHGVAGIQSRLRDKIRSERKSLDLVPDSLEYFENFCGPDPGHFSPDEYLTSILPAYRKELLRRDLQSGLEICLLGALRDDLYPGPWLDGIDNDLLWKSLIDCQPRRDPISLLAALDLALLRQEDERFRMFAKDVFRDLVAEHFILSNEIDSYRLIPILAKFVLNQINLMDGGTLRPPFWKRMCAWMQATFIARTFVPADFDTFSVSVAEHLEVAGAHANTLDLRREPMMEAGSMESLALRRKIVGGLTLLPMRHPDVSESILEAQEIEQASIQLQQQAPPLSWQLPGPLEGYRRPQEAGKTLPAELEAKLSELSDELLFANLANISQHVGLSEKAKELLRAATSREKRETALEQRLENLLRLATITAAERDTSMAQTAAESVWRLAPKLEDERMVWAAVEILLRSSAAFEDEATWAEWIERQFLALSSRIQAGRPSLILWHHLKALKKVTRLELGMFRRAEGTASAAASWQ